jgi:hypothetical protein
MVEIPIEMIDVPSVEQATADTAPTPPGNRITDDHADASDIASLSEPLPWLKKPPAEVRPTRVVHVARHIPHPAPVDSEQERSDEATPTDTSPPPSESPVNLPHEQETEHARQPSLLGTAAELFPEGSIWRTVGMGILITAGLAMLIRALSGED